MEIIRKEYSIKSKSLLTNIYARCWMPDTGAKAVIQIAHGMAEHGERYEDFARFLCEKGYAVLVNDHLGHGKSVKSDDMLGYFGDKNGWDTLVCDERDLTEMIEKEMPELPIIFFGHSMGSFVAREYMRRYSRDPRIKGAVFCGTAGKNPAAGIGIKLANTIIKAKGARHYSKLLNSISFGSYNKKISNPRTEFDWLSTDENQVDKYVADKYCGFVFTAAGYKDLFTILSAVSDDKWYKEVNNSLPILLVSGQEDPVGAYGTGVKEVYSKLAENGKIDVTFKLFPAMRHEILNEKDNRRVYEYIENWFAEKLEK